MTFHVNKHFAIACGYIFLCTVAILCFIYTRSILGFFPGFCYAVWMATYYALKENAMKSNQ
jgi:hypothetical protein